MNYKTQFLSQPPLVEFNLHSSKITSYNFFYLNLVNQVGGNMLRFYNNLCWKYVIFFMKMVTNLAKFQGNSGKLMFEVLC